MGGRCVVIAAALAISLAVADVRAEEGVYVDLSVLNSLPATDFSGPQFSSQPLFPEVKKAARPQVPSVKPKKARKAAKKKQKAVVNKVEVVEKVTVPAKPQIVVPAVEEKAETPQPVQITDTAANREVIAEVASPEKTSEVSVQKPADDMPFQTEAMPAVVENPLPAVVAPVKNEELPALEPVHENAMEAVVPAETKTPDEVKENVAENVSPAEEAPIQPLISDYQEPKLPVSENSILFEEGLDELNDTQKQQVDEIIRKFENPEKNKIMILSYNYEDGKDSFKKKRISLNRAIEVRSYLLGKGYKNFSIKVINISGDAEKRNLVEIEELK